MLDVIVRRCLLLCCWLLCVQQAQAADGDKPFTISGFGTVGAVYSDTGQVDIVRDLLQARGVGYSSQLDFGVDSLLGLQLSTSILDNLDASVQVVSRRSQTGFDPDVTWAFLKYNPNDNLQLRAGRLGFDVYLLADSRNVAYSYLWVRPPIDYFGNLIVSYIDGADMVIKYPVGPGIARFKAFAGKAREKTYTGVPDQYFSLKGSDVVGGHVEYQTESWMYRVGYSQIRFKNEFPGFQGLIDGLRSPAINAISPLAATVAGNIGFQDKAINYLSAGIAYDEGPLQAQLMLSQTKSAILPYPGFKAGYFTAGYRIKKWTPYFSYSAATPEHRQSNGNTGLPFGINPNIDILILGANALANTVVNKQSTLSLGARYDLGDKIDLKIQVDHVDSTSPQVTRNAQPGWDGKANLLSVSVNFVF
ncbi:hypothetical protein QN372_03810 [Undibacterium sp. RTI2.1]|uniref:porin n=1 Tax=unclassified Undibacterium TaxID=2630295 RepID=UPI002AB43F0C|nr:MULTISPECIES: porin [unclassified Undibacterium]MDY7537097.1 hypothetical protein [Undibacterium sp. 5I1]MEB0029864.1 hypothetical protein [Undibacterium sp. RTI2.1]MEB0115149.1 hypothetical protein [Undibacterium sp. RTI2.2]MEB0229275.1 hypothetical protein [Undibacterium sp. 10I3]MEB0256177.1 hypothetical protein [Undibacterium sp. 5I1]